MPREAQVLELETIHGVFREHYAERRPFFEPWHRGVWNHLWHLNKGLPCALCGSTAPSIRVDQITVCFPCLHRFAHVPWHPTGLARPKTMELLSHAESCTSHSSLPTLPLLRFGGAVPELSSLRSGAADGSASTS